jgi:general secretion pathway protein A
VEEGLIEVGWEGNIEAEASSSDPAARETEDAVLPVSEAEPPGEEVVEDHYAALQAWAEWARNRSRTAPAQVAGPSDSLAADEPFDEVETEAGFPEARSLAQGIRAEAQHEHAPYSQLFTRLRQSR